MILSQGTRLGPYDILAPLGAGGMGEVYLASDSRLARKVALKCVNDARASSPEARARLLHEARAAATLNHPNIAAIYDVLDAEGHAIIVMEYVPGETLAERLARGRPSGDEARSIATQLARALVHAHAAGIIHRDLKPANVKFTPDGRVKVLDFGLARVADVPHDATPDTTTVVDDLARSRPGVLAGTPAYMAPEQLLGRPADQRSDIYGLGVLLFQLLTGRLPFEAGDMFTLALAVTSSSAPRVSDIEPGAPADLDAIIARAMAKEPAARYQSAAELLQDLERPPGTGDRRRRGRVPRWAWVSALALAIVAVTLLAVVVQGGWYRPRGGPVARATPQGRAEVVAVLPFENRTGDAARDYLAAGAADLLVTRLAALGSITVASSPSLREGRKLAGDVRAAARELGADLVVTGGVSMSEGRVLVDTRLTQPDGKVLWGDTRDAPAGDILSVYAQLTQGLMNALGLEPTARAQERITRQPAASVEAYVEYLRGKEWMERQDVTGHVAQAVAAFERAVQQDASFARAHAALADALWQQYTAAGDTAAANRARLEAERALALDPDDLAVRISMANIYRGTGKADLAARELRQAVALEPGNDNAHRMLAQTLATLGRDAEALEQFRGAIAIRPDYWRNHTALGGYYYRTAKYDQAVEAFRRATELQPEGVAAFANLGASHQALGQYARAIQAYERALVLSPDDHVTLSNIGTIHYAEGRYADAVRAYERACAAAPHRAEYFRNLGDARLRTGDRRAAADAYDEAVSLAAEQVKLNPQDGRRLAQLAVYAAKAGRHADAERHAARAVSLQPGAADVLYYAAIARALVGNRDGALAMLQGAIARGYSRDLARKDDDLAALRGLPAFAALVKPSP
jgi:serine/threonine-protein kinase